MMSSATVRDRHGGQNMALNSSFDRTARDGGPSPSGAGTPSLQIQGTLDSSADPGDLDGPTTTGRGLDDDLLAARARFRRN